MANGLPGSLPEAETGGRRAGRGHAARHSFSPSFLYSAMDSTYINSFHLSSRKLSVWACESRGYRGAAAQASFLSTQRHAKEMLQAAEAP